MLLGLGIAVYVGQSAGAEGGFFHLLNHGLMKGLAFLAAGALMYVLYIAKGDHTSPLTISDLSGTVKRYPVIALTLSIAVLGLGGLPPLAGFMSKWQIFVAGFATQNTAIDLLVIFAALNSVLSLAYYAPLVNAVYREQPRSR
jgi:NADH:ubiquinone oxidoreductase subunit 2 (subunit N)